MPTSIQTHSTYVPRPIPVFQQVDIVLKLNFENDSST